jgi:rRNA-processing protein FCF1
MVYKVLLDTNFLLIPAQFGVDIYSELDRIMLSSYRVYILDRTIGELGKIASEQRGRIRRDVRLALSMVEQKVSAGEIGIIDTSHIPDDMSVDDIMVSYDAYVVATQDMELQRRLKDKGIKVISMRQKRYLFFRP